MRVPFVFFIGAAFVGMASAASLTADHGHIALNGKAITSGARDSDPVLSPDGKRVVFVRDRGGKPIRDCSGSDDETRHLELWTVQADGRGAKKLLAVHSEPDVKNTVCAFSNLQFTSNGQWLYFETPAWATSGALHVYDFKTGKARFVLASNGAKVLNTCRDAKYRDALIVAQHRYFVFGGSYDWLWLFSPTATEIGPIGEDDDMAKDACG